MSETRICRTCGKRLWNLNPEAVICEDCRIKTASGQATHDETSLSSELPRDFPSYVKQTGEIPGAFSDAVLERVRSEASVALPQPQDPGKEPLWSWQAGVLVWLASVACLFSVSFVFFVIGGFYLQLHGQPLTQDVIESSVPFAIIQIFSTFPAHLLSLAIAWSVVTRFGKRAFLATMGWTWHRRFGPVHVVIFIILMYGIGAVLSKFIPDHPNQFDHLMKLVTATKVGKAVLFLVVVVSAPFQEEVIYRGVLFPGLQGKFGTVWSVIIVSLIFGGVHIPQYWPSYQTIAFLMTLSIGLTTVRAYTKSILPTFVIHLLFNGAQVVLNFTLGQ